MGNAEVTVPPFCSISEIYYAKIKTPITSKKASDDMETLCSTLCSQVSSKNISSNTSMCSCVDPQLLFKNPSKHCALT